MPDLRVGIVGPESSGKTTLAEGLQEWVAQQGINVRLVAEQGRALAERLPAGHPWSWREQQATSLMHRAAEAQDAILLDLEPGPGVLIADGTPATPLVWHMCAVRRRPHYDAGPAQLTEELLDALERGHYDVVLLATPDLPWVADGIRDDPDGRAEAFEIYRTLYPDAHVIAADLRLQQATRVVSGLLPTPR